ncbi:MAG: hypothetical protein A2Z20_07320 [Bdellovibrionales bacterium RBG_16_40_8]|nr:MAG: hypothetical protein A2Z20_07320 [Bdellovibrionales bacterium RBG_16_40_8]
MKKNTVTLIVSILFISLQTLAQSINQAISFQDSLRIALEKNPKPKSKDIQILALKDRTTAAWLGFLPTFSESCDYTQDKSTTRVLGIPSRTSDIATGCSTSIDLNIFKGGRGYYEAKTAEARQKAMAAIFNSTNPLVENSKGALATLLLNTYTAIIMNQDTLELLDSITDILNRALAATSDPDDINAYKAFMATVAIQKQNALNKITLSKEDYLFEVTQVAPDRLDSFDDFINSFQIPVTPEEALAQAKLSSPDLKRRVYELQQADYATKIAWSQAYMPTIDVYYSNYFSNDIDRLDSNNNYNYHNQSAGISLSWIFSFQKKNNLSAARKELQSAQLEQLAVIDDLKHNIKKTYMNYEATSSVLEKYRQKYEMAKDQAYSDIERLESKNPISRTDLINDLNDYSNAGSNLIYAKQGVVILKFTVQQVTGTLFTNVGVAVE